MFAAQPLILPANTQPLLLAHGFASLFVVALYSTVIVPPARSLWEVSLRSRASWMPTIVRTSGSTTPALSPLVRPIHEFELP